jgi:hypothetical protein
MAKGKKTIPEGFHEVFTPWITLKNGKRLYATAYGRKCWRILVRDKK